MKALVTGASSGIGKEIAIYLDKLGYEVILVARDKEGLENVQKDLVNRSKIVVIDLCDINNLKSLYVLCKNEGINVVINNAGFGLFGQFDKTDLSKELDMIDLNIKSVHILTKLFLRDMVKKGEGYILNVGSSASFMPGPLMATYYSTKAYVLRLTQAINYELKKDKSKVVVSCLCPGPVDTNFNNVANVKFAIKPLSAQYVAKYAVDNMFKGKSVIVPGFKMKLARIFTRFLSNKFIMSITYKIQKRKEK